MAHVAPTDIGFKNEWSRRVLRSSSNFSLNSTVQTASFLLIESLLIKPKKAAVQLEMLVFWLWRCKETSRNGWRTFKSSFIIETSWPCSLASSPIFRRSSPQAIWTQSISCIKRENARNSESHLVSPGFSNLRVVRWASVCANVKAFDPWNVVNFVMMLRAFNLISRTFS